MLIVFAVGDYGGQAVLQSSIHQSWAREYASSMRTDLRYTPSDCFETFVLPIVRGCAGIGERYDGHRRSLMLARREGLTKTYNRAHNPKDSSDDIVRLRELQVEMDRAVADAYAWTDLDLGHGFHETKQGVRFTLSETARREVLARLLRLNHERFAEEVRQGLHDRKRRRARAEEAEADGGDLLSEVADP